MISALFANTNYDESPQEREKAITSIENNYNEVMYSIYNGTIEEDEIGEENPFFAAHKKGMIEQGIPEVSEFLANQREVSIEEEPDLDFEFDQG